MTWLNRLGTWVLKSFRGLICEKKDGGWELSTGRVMAWIIFHEFMVAASTGEAAAEWLFWGWVAAMSYCGYTKSGLSSAFSKLASSRGK